MIISLIHPSRGRPEKARETREYWKEQSSGYIQIQHIASLDYSDPLAGKYTFGEGSIIVHGDNDCVVAATNRAALLADGDILVYLSDDFKCPKNWDLSISQQFESLVIPGLLKVDDCLQPFDKDVLTIPIMNKALYKRLGYFWNPIYKSMFVDQDLYWVCANSNWLIFARHLKFPHEHYSVGKAANDRTYRESEKHWDSGKAIYQQRKREGFSI